MEDAETNIAWVFNIKSQVNVSFLCGYISKIAVLKNDTFEKTAPLDKFKASDKILNPIPHGLFYTRWFHEGGGGGC